MYKKVSSLLAGACCMLISFSSFAEGLPADWSKWISAKTPLMAIGALPDCEADVSSLPPIYQETVATYCSVKPGGPGKVNILIDPAVEKVYAARKGGYQDGVNLLLHLVDMKLLFATEHVGGQPKYRIFKETGEEVVIDQAGHPLHADTCATCHTGYSAYCVEGQCGIQQ